MKLPFLDVKVGAYFVKVRLSDTVLSDASAYGYADRTKGEIVLDSSLHGTRLADAFLHEVLHCLWAYFGADNDSQASAVTPQGLSEEQVVTRVSFALTTFWHDNPVVHTWWTKLLREK